MENPNAQKSSSKVGSDLFTAVHVLDPRISEITSKLKFAVEKSGQNVTTYRLANNSNGSTTNASFNFHSPGVSSIIDRNMYIRGQVELTVNLKATAAAAAGNPVKWGTNSALAPFPFHQLLSNGQMTINNDSHSMEFEQLLNVIHRVIPEHQLNEWNSLCPTMADKYAAYAAYANAAAIPINHPWQGYGALTRENHPNGAFPADLDYTEVPAPAAGDPPAAGTPTTLKITFPFCEPLLFPVCAMSHHGVNDMGLSGVNTLNWQFNFNNKCRALRTAVATGTGTGEIQSVSISALTNLEVLLRVITPQVDQALPVRSLVPFYNYQRNMIDAPSDSSSLTSSSVNLNQIPDSVILCVRKKNPSYNDPDAVLPIKTVNIQFANRDGIMSGATKEQLYVISKDNGINQPWSEWSGSAYQGGAQVATTGSYVMLKFGRDISLQESFLAPGTLGKYSFQAQVNLENPVPAGQYELCCVFMNSSFMVTQAGSSVSYSGSLTPSVVDQASRLPPVSSSSIDRMVGGKWSLGSLKSVGSFLKKAIKPVGKALRKELQSSGNDSAKMIGDVAEVLGLGMTAGARSRHFR